tara:strand:- start:930 stop:1130 length:201 start_codon:yes stop_codon:yes gene_type:complete
LDSYHVLDTSKFFDMSKKISKKTSAIRTISLAVGSLSLLVIAVSQIAEKEICTSSDYSIVNQIKLS